jgi:ribonuclease BN (tRNA processing enzyme)
MNAHQADAPLETRVTILGSGTCVPSLFRSACAVLVETGGSRLLLDLGPGTMRRLLEAGVPIEGIDWIVLSHFHPDHSGELAAFLFATRYGAAPRRRPLTVAGGPGLQGFFQRLEALYGRWIALPPEEFGLVELAGEACRQEGAFQLETAATDHNPESIALRITGRDGRSLVYSGDTGPDCPGLRALARGVDLLICEASLPDAQRRPGHLSPLLAGRLAAAAEVGALVLTHFYPACEAIDIEAECRRAWSGPLLIAQDLLRIRPAPFSGPETRGSHPCATIR